MISNKLKRANIRFYPHKLWYAPEWLVLGVNNICNLHCKMCDVGTGYTQSNFFANLMGSQPLNMPLELIRRIIEQASRYFPRVKLGYAFTEPLIYPHLEESIAYATHKGLYTSVTTNALNLKQKARPLAEAGLKDLFISLDGPPAIHNAIRGHPHSFERALAGIEVLLNLPDRPAISVFCCITEWNSGHLVDFVDSFKHLPLKQLGLMHTNFTPPSLAEAHNALYGALYPATDSNVMGMEVNRIDLEQLWQQTAILRQKSYPFPLKFSPEISNREALEVFYRKPEQKIGNICNDAFRNIMIKSDGSVIPAHGRCYQVDVGNLYEKTLKEIWNSEAMGKFRKDLINAGGLFPACARCCSAF